PRAWQRTVLLAPPLFVIAARIDMGKHFLSDVAASALIAACMALLVSAALRHWQANEHDSEAIRASRC
ncbi:MAG: phosphatase PAP2 family protein, partial [Dokdonella sp.]